MVSWVPDMDPDIVYVDEGVRPMPLRDVVFLTLTVVTPPEVVVVVVGFLASSVAILLLRERMPA